VVKRRESFNFTFRIVFAIHSNMIFSMITIQEATLQDIDLIREIAGKTWFATYREILSTEQMEYMFEMMYSVKSITRQMTELNHRFFFAIQKGKPLGYVSIQQQKVDLFHLHKLYILPEGQGKGVGKILFNKAADFAKEHANGKTCTMELNMNRENKARYFYEKMGMHICEEGDFEIGGGYFMNDYIFRIEYPATTSGNH